MENILHTVDNTVLLYLQDELEHIGTCLENFDLPTPDECNRYMRVYDEEVTFSSYLFAVGDGSEKVHTDIAEDMIQIPEQYLVGSMEELIKKVFPQVDKFYSDKYFVL